MYNLNRVQCGLSWWKLSTRQRIEASIQPLITKKHNETTHWSFNTASRHEKTLRDNALRLQYSLSSQKSTTRQSVETSIQPLITKKHYETTHWSFNTASHHEKALRDNALKLQYSLSSQKGTTRQRIEASIQPLVTKKHYETTHWDFNTASHHEKTLRDNALKPQYSLSWRKSTTRQRIEALIQPLVTKKHYETTRWVQ